jgi:hypothetical protein
MTLLTGVFAQIVECRAAHPTVAAVVFNVAVATADITIASVMVAAVLALAELVGL